MRYSRQNPDEKSFFIDTHTHLDFPQFDGDRDEVIERAESFGVVRIVNPGVDLESSQRAIKLSENYYHVFAAVGIHPHETANLPNDWLERLEHLACHPKVVAIGEIGLDFYRDLSPRDTQKRVFSAQIELAKKLSLPMILHIRNAHNHVKKILEEHGYFKGVMHAYSGDEKFLSWALDKGFYIGFGGPVTFKNYKKHYLVRMTPLERILSETDCPYLSPHPYRGKRNEPARIPLIVEKIAEVCGKTLSETAYTIAKNAEKLFGIPAPAKAKSVKSLGQNFLINSKIADRIANLSGEGELCIEIGPGKGILTERLVNRFSRVIALELDEDLVRLLWGKFENLFVVHMDFLRADISRISRFYGTKAIVVGNIPYSVTSPILFHILAHRTAIKEALLMVQREVAERLLASPGSKTYGIPTVILGRHFTIKRCFNVSPANFRPQPEVTSTVIKLIPREEPLCPDVDDELFSKVVHKAFAHRRKTLANNLKESFPEIYESLLGEYAGLRAEQLNIMDFCEICRKLRNFN